MHHNKKLHLVTTLSLERMLSIWQNRLWTFAGISNGRLSGLLVNISLYGFAIAFVITTAISLRCVDDLSYWFLSCHEIFFSLLFFPSVYLWMLPVPKQDFLTGVCPKNNTIWLPLLIWTAICICGCRTIQHSFCYHNEGSEASCEFADAYYMLLFGVIQIILSQIPNFHNIEWLSVVAAIMSFTYSFIGMGLSIAQIIGMMGALAQAHHKY